MKFFLKNPKKLKKKSASPSKPEIERLQKQNSEQTENIKELLNDVKGMKEVFEKKIASPNRLKESSSKDKMKILESKISFLNLQLNNSNIQLEKLESIIKERDNDIRSLENELKNKMKKITSYHLQQKL